MTNRCFHTGSAGTPSPGITDTDTRVTPGDASCTRPENRLHCFVEKPSLGARRADALVALAENDCTGYEVRLHVPAGTSAHAISLESGGTIPYAAAKRLCCDAAIVPVMESAAGELLDIGRRSRKIPPPMRRALEIRDKGTCRFPGCTHTRYLHGHHIKHWADDGKTCLDNLVLLCSHHHGLVHEGGFACTALRRSGSKGVSIVFRRPDGVIIPEAFRLAAVAENIESLHKQLDINEDTCTARDAGSPLDVNVVLDALEFRRKHRK